MWQYALRKTLLAIPTLLGVLTLTFIIMRVAPGDPLLTLLGDFAEYASEEQLAEIREQWGIDKPLVIQYVYYLRDILSWDFGFSFRQKAPVMSLIAGFVLPTVMLAFGGLFFSAIIGIPAGIISALRRNTAVDYSVVSFATVGLAAPNFWLGILLIYIFAFRLGWLPMFGSGDLTSLTSTLHHLVLPAITIGTAGAALVARMTRSSMLEIMSHDYIRTARAKGLHERVVLGKHVFRNAAIPIVTILGLDIAYLLGGSVIVETVFSRAGLGKLLIDSILTRDYPMVQALVTLFALVIVAVNLLVDLSYALINPRMTYS